MACVQILKSSLSPISFSPFDSLRQLSFCSSKFDSEVTEKRILRLQSYSKFGFRRRYHHISCKVQEGDNQSNGEEPPESLFMKELKRRGMTPSSLLEQSNRSAYEDQERKLKEEEGAFSRTNAVSTDVETSLSNQRERSMALNSEGLEGLVPRAKLLLTLGGTFFLGFWPLILVTVAFFSTLYLYFGPSFIHDARKSTVALPQYVDPYALLEDERISQTAPNLN